MVRDAALKFTRELPDTLAVRSVSTDAIRIGEQDYRDTVVVAPDEVIDGWCGKPVQDLVADDFSMLLARKPELVLLGAGTASRFAPRELTFAFARAGVGLELMDTAAAARTFNVLAGEGRRVIAVLYLGPSRQ